MAQPIVKPENGINLKNIKPFLMNTKICLLTGLLMLLIFCLSPSGHDNAKDAKIRTVWDLYNKSASLYDSKPDSANYYGHQCYNLALEINYPEGQSLGLTNIAYVHYIKGNYPAALDTFHKAIEIDDEYSLLKRKASHYNNIGNIYKAQEDFQRALKTYDTSFQIADKNKFDSVLCNASMNLGYVFEKLKKADSAKKYETIALNQAQKLPYRKNLNIIYNNFGKIYQLNNNRDAAIVYFYTSIAESDSSNDFRGRSESYIFLADLHEQYNEDDSSILLAKKGLDIAAKASYPRGELLACEILEKAYKKKLHENRPIVDSSFYYFVKRVEIEKMLFNKDNVQKVEQLTMAFNKKQDELNAELKRRDDARRQIIQIVLVALGLIFLFSVLLLIMKKKIKNRAVEIGGLLTVLLLFEFINLLIHPIVESITNHNFASMLLILVLPAALLARWHHRFEHWIKMKFSKNPI